MKHIRFFLVVLVLFAGTQSIAQNYQKQYLSAKSFYNEGEYKLAIEAFRPLAKRSSDNPFAAYASYYYGMSNYYAGFKEEARTVFLQTKNQFPNWSKIDDVNYWLAKLYFENEDHFLALNIAESVRDPQVKADIDAMTVHYLNQDADVEEMKAIYDKHNNKATGSVYAAKLAQEPLDARGRKTLDQLIKQYKLDPDQFLASVKSTQLKDSYKVAVMMPFLIETIKPGDKNRVNEFVLDLYNGMDMAFNDLRDQGIDIQVYAYDTERDTTATRALLNQDELKGMDMIIGPLFSGPAKIVSEFGLQYGINVINPLSNSPQNMAGNPHYFLMQPSAVTIGEAMADFASQYYSEKPGVVLFGQSDNDIQMARAYTIRFQELTGTKLISRGVGNEDTEEILQLLLSTTSIKEATTEEGRENMQIALDSLGHIYVASSNSLIFSKVVSAVETRGDEIQIIGSADWIEMPVVKFETFERLKVQFYAPGYIDQLSESYKEFQTKYMRKHKVVPSKFSDRGYEMAMFLGNSLAEYGSYPQLAWESEGRMPGTFTPGYFYPNKQDNQVVPVLEFGEEGLEILVRENTELKADNDN